MPKVKEARTLASGLRRVDRYEDTAVPAVTNDASDDVGVGTYWNRVDADGAVIAVYVCTDATEGAAVWSLVDEVTNKRHVAYIDEVVTFAGDASKDLVTQIPAGAVPLYAVTNNESALVLSTAVKLGVGTVADPDGYALTGTGVTKNTKNSGKGALAGIRVAAATTITVSACATGGTVAGTVTSGSFRVRVFYETYDALPDAA